MASTTLLVYGIPSIVDDRCVYNLFDNKVKQVIFSGYSLGRMAIVDLYDAAFRDSILRQSHAGAILAKSLNAKKAQRTIRANAKKEAEEAKRKNSKRGRRAEAEAAEDSLNNPEEGITLMELLQQEMNGGASSPNTAASASSSGAAVADSFGGLTPEFGPFSTVIINGWRIGICASPLSIDDFKAIGGNLIARKEGDEVDGKAARKAKGKARTESGDNDAELAVTEVAETAAAEQTYTEGEDAEAPVYESKRKQRRSEFFANKATALQAEFVAAGGEIAVAAASPSSNGKKEVVLQSTRMKAVNQQAPAFGDNAAKSKITFSDDDDDAPKKPASLASKAAVATAAGDDEEKQLNNRDRKKLAAAAKTATTSKFKFDDSDSD